MGFLLNFLPTFSFFTPKLFNYVKTFNIDFLG